MIAILLAMKILWCVPCFPFDPTGGGNRSLRTMCEMLASQGHEVRCVGTFSTGGPLGKAPTNFLRDSVEVEDWKESSTVVPLYFRFRNVHYRLVESMDAIDPLRWNPDILLTYGGNPQDLARMRRAKQAGVKVVFGLRNGLYRDKEHFQFCDGIVTPSRWMSDWYKRTSGLDTTPLPLPINVEDCVATYPPETYPTTYGEVPGRYVTMVNPSHEKGEQLTRAIATALPEVPFLIVESRGRAQNWPANCKIAGPFPNPREIYWQTKILLVPSLWEEPGGRVVCEAMLNGIPPLVSDHGALPEVAEGGGIIIKTPRKLYDHSPVTAEELAPWVFATALLIDHWSFNQKAAKAASCAGQKYDSRALTPLYCDYFESILKGVHA
jgi:glycosyltransferase involved in cell wall biosynthesis